MKLSNISVILCLSISMSIVSINAATVKDIKKLTTDMITKAETQMKQITDVGLPRVGEIMTAIKSIDKSNENAVVIDDSKAKELSAVLGLIFVSEAELAAATEEEF